MNETQDLSALRRAHTAPEDRVPAPKRNHLTRLALPGVALLAFLAVLLYAGRDALTRRVDVRVVPVVLKTVDGAPGAGVSTQAAGWVEPDPFPVHVAALTAGIVSEVLVLDGQVVAKDEVVARLLPDEAKLALARAEAMLAAAKSELAIQTARAAAAQTGWDQPVERTREVATARAELASSTADAEGATRTAAAEAARAGAAEERLRRAEADLRAGAIAEVEVATMRRESEAMAAAARAARAAAESAMSKVEGAKASLDAAVRNAELRIPERLSLAEANAMAQKAQAEVARAEVERDEAALRLARTEVRSPVSGTVMHRLVEPGMQLPPEGAAPGFEHAVSVYDPAKLQVRADVPLVEAAKIGVGTKARIIVEVLPDKPFEGEVTRIVHAADLQKNTLQVKVRIHAPVALVKPDMLARVQFLYNADPSAKGTDARRLFAPERLLLADSDGDEVVWIVDPSAGRARRRTVERGSWKKDGWVEIASGLNAGDELIDPAGVTLEEGMRVRVAGPAALDASGGR